MRRIRSSPPKASVRSPSQRMSRGLPSGLFASLMLLLVAALTPAVSAAAAQASASITDATTGLSDAATVAPVGACGAPSPFRATCLAQVLGVRGSARARPSEAPPAGLTVTGSSGRERGAATPPRRPSQPPVRPSPERRRTSRRPTTSPICRRPRGLARRRDRRCVRRSQCRVRPRNLPRRVRVVALHHRQWVLHQGRRERRDQLPVDGRLRLGARDLARSRRGVRALPELPHHPRGSQQRRTGRTWRRHRPRQPASPEST